MAENDLILDTKEQKSMAENTILAQHLINNAEALQQLGKDIGLLNHCVNLGTAREGLIANFLKQNLPESIGYHPGELFDHKGTRSGQIDIVLHPITSPKINLYNTINLFPAETVLATIEVKSNLDKKDINNALDSSVKVKALEFIERDAHGYERISGIADFEKIPFVVFAYQGSDISTLIKNMEEHSEKTGINFRSFPDLIVVLDKNYSLFKKFPDFMSGTTTIDNLYSVNDENVGKPVLTDLFNLLLSVNGRCCENPKLYSMPVSRYVENIKEVTLLY